MSVVLPLLTTENTLLTNAEKQFKAVGRTFEIGSNANLAVVAEHTGIYIGNRQIVHLNGNGHIEAVSPEVFCARLDGINPAQTIYIAQRSGKALGKDGIADRARLKLGGMRDYNVVFDNCHQFTCGCISGDFENPCNFFWMVEMEIRAKLGSFSWAVWNY